MKCGFSHKFYVLEFGPWLGWESCSVTCGSGERRRTRQCIRPGTCSGSNSETQSCYEGQCPGVTSTMVYYFIFSHIWSFVKLFYNYDIFFIFVSSNSMESVDPVFCNLWKWSADQIQDLLSFRRLYW